MHNLDLSVNVLFLKRCNIFQFCLQRKKVGGQSQVASRRRCRDILTSSCASSTCDLESSVFSWVFSAVVVRRFSAIASACSLACSQDILIVARATLFALKSLNACRITSLSALEYDHSTALNKANHCVCNG